MKLHPLERRLFAQGFTSIAGTDEVGRGCWAGPLVAGCVMIDSSFSLRRGQARQLVGVADSKELSAKSRERLFAVITDFLPWAVGLASVDEIDRLGLQVANRLAMERAVAGLSCQPDFLLIDYLSGLAVTTPHKSVVRGDAKLFCVAAASIVAKVYRDRLMANLPRRYRFWKFERHKGYGTSLHRSYIQKYGVCNLHRKNFSPIALYEKSSR